MGLETGNYISDLVATNPTSADAKSQGDDHLRLIKTVLKTTFPALTGAVTVSQTILNYLTGLTGSVQTQIDNEIAARQAGDNAKGSVAGQTWTGSHDFTGATVTVATKALGTNTTDAASTAFVVQGFAPLDSPVFTGSPTAPTPVFGDSSTKIATTEFVSSLAFSSALPAQTGNAGKFVTTDGANASWRFMDTTGSTIYMAQNFGAF